MEGKGCWASFMYFTVHRPQFLVPLIVRIMKRKELVDKGDKRRGKGKGKRREVHAWIVSVLSMLTAQLHREREGERGKERDLSKHNK